MKKINVVSLILIASFWMSAGCASMFSNRVYNIQVESDPQGAKATLYKNSQKTVVLSETTTPGSVKMDMGRLNLQDETMTLTLKKEGYKEKNVLIEKELNYTTFWNACLLPFWWVGALIDLGTGKIFKPADLHLKIKLEPESKPSGANKKPKAGREAARRKAPAPSS